MICSNDVTINGVTPGGVRAEQPPTDLSDRTTAGSRQTEMKPGNRIQLSLAARRRNVMRYVLSACKPHPSVVNATPRPAAAK